MQSSGRDGTFVFGRISWTIGGVGFGDWQDSSLLNAAAAWGRTFLQDSGRREAPFDDDLAGERAMWELNDRLYPPYSDVTGPRREFSMEMVGMNSIFDSAHVACVRLHDRRDRMLARRLCDDALVDVVMPPGTVDDVVRSFCEWVDRL
jgi:hypothetical protein